MPTITEICRELRRNETGAEKILWQHLRDGRFFGYKFLRQHPISISITMGKNLYYIPDFYCAKLYMGFKKRLAAAITPS
jgi:very-short-patch-repair endonuclease